MKSRITAEEFERAQYEAAAANLILKGKQFGFLREYFSQTLKDTEHKILNNSITDVREELTINVHESEKGIIPKLKRIFFIPKKVQVDELVGAYKFIKKFWADMEHFASLPDELLKAEEQKKVIIEVNREKR